MAIEFSCTECQARIEVDDLHAGKQAQCPFCQAIVGVPAQAVAAAPLSGPATPPVRAGLGLGRAALAVALLSYVLMFIFMIAFAATLPERFHTHTGPVTAEDQQALVQHFQANPGMAATLVALVFGAVIAAPTALGLAIASVRKRGGVSIAAGFAMTLAGFFLLSAGLLFALGLSRGAPIGASV